MSSYMSWFTGKKDTQTGGKAQNAIIELRQHMLMIDKKEEHIMKLIEQDNATARANATTNKQAAMRALRNKKLHEAELDRISGTRLTLETQMNALESANMNLQTMEAMKRGSEALKGIHGKMNIDKVDATMDSIREQMVLTNEISEAISNPVGMHYDADEDELKNELEALEQETLNDRLLGAERAPVHTPAVPGGRIANVPQQEEDDGEEEELRRLQAEMAM